MGTLRRIQLIAIALVISSFISCTKRSEVKLPEGVVVPDTMIQVLTEVHILESSLQMGVWQSPTDTAAKQAFQALWNRHHMTESTYNKSLNFYLANPKLLDSMYDKILNNLNQQKAELMGKKNR